VKSGRVIIAFVLLTAVMVLAGCGESTPNAAPQATSTLIPEIYTPNPSYTFFPTVTATSLTPRPTYTPWSTKTPDPYMVALGATQTNAAQFPGNCGSFEGLLMSPNGNWLATNCYGDQNFRVIKRDGTKTWTITYESVFSSHPNYPYNIGGVYPRFWSTDSQFLYFEPVQCCWDPGIILISNYSRKLLRFDITTGETATILKGGLHYLSLSPTGRRLVSVSELTSPIIVNIMDLKTGNEDSFILGVDENYRQAGRIVWSPDGKKLVIVAVYGYEFWPQDQPTEAGIFSLIFVNLDDFSQKILLRDSTDWVSPVALTKDGILTYSSGSPLLSN
jgi:hypothetical protein